MKEYCVDLEIAKELEENGFPQETNFYHRIQKDGIGEFTDFSDTHLKSDFMTIINVYSAPTTDEILKELPKKLYGCHLEIDRTDVAYYIWYAPIGTNIDQRPKDFVAGSMGKKLANALAQKWLYLKKERLLNEVQRK